LCDASLRGEIDPANPPQNSKKKHGNFSAVKENRSGALTFVDVRCVRCRFVDVLTFVAWSRRVWTSLLLRQKRYREHFACDGLGALDDNSDVVEKKQLEKLAAKFRKICFTVSAGVPSRQIVTFMNEKLVPTWTRSTGP